MRSIEIQKHTIEQPRQKYFKWSVRRMKQAYNVRMRCCLQQSIKLKITAYQMLLQSCWIVNRLKIKDTVRITHKLLQLIKYLLHTFMIIIKIIQCLTSNTDQSFENNHSLNISLNSIDFLLLVNYQLISASKQMRVADSVQVRCNFCFNWISGKNLVKKTINSCQECVKIYVLPGFDVHTINGEVYKLAHIKERQAKDYCSKSFIDCLSQLRSHRDHSQKWEEVNNAIEQKQIIYEDEDPLLSNLKQAKEQRYKQDNLDFIKKYNTKSQLMINDDSQDVFQFGKSHQSCIFNDVNKVKEQKEPMTGAKSMRRFDKLQDFGRSLDKTRFLQRYQYYYDNDAIKSYTQQHPKIQREFGDELINIPQFNLNLNTKKSVQRIKTSRSNISSEMSVRNHKINEQELKIKIEACLENKYQSQSLQRIVIGNVKEAYQKTNIQNRTLELTSYKLEDIDMHCYLSLFDLQHIQTIKLINVGLTDQQLTLIIDFISDKKIQILVLTGNKLTENSLSLISNRNMPYLKEIYLGKNPISKYRMKQNINELKGRFLLYI